MDKLKVSHGQNGGVTCYYPIMKGQHGQTKAATCYNEGVAWTNQRFNMDKIEVSHALIL